MFLKGPLSSIAYPQGVGVDIRTTSHPLAVLRILKIEPLPRIPRIRLVAVGRDAAKDSGSGVDTIQIQTFRNHKTIIKPYASSNRIKLSTAARHIRLRVVDRAGNASEWKTVSMAR